MKWSKVLLPTLKEVPQDAEAISHILMIRAGLIRKLTSGVYSYLPLGMRVLKKVTKIIQEEMNNQGAQEMLLPAIQPVDLWQQSGRLETLGEDMITFTDRHKKLNVLGPTHEEVITNLIKNEIRSYRQLPIIVYQIQTKFRDEARPRFGVMRSREFIMKDAYSFDRDEQGLDHSYKKMYEAYCNIFRRCGLNYIAVEADTGIMGGDISHEFMVIADNGEDKIIRCKKCDYAVSLDKAECLADYRPQTTEHSSKAKSMEEVSTPGVSSVKEVAHLLKVKPAQLIKTIIYLADNQPVAILIRGDYEINETKLNRVLKAQHLIMADEGAIKKITNGPRGFSGPVELENIKIIADYSIQGLKNAITGANKIDRHLINVNESRDFKVDIWADVRNITENDFCPRCKNAIQLSQAIEVGHVFKLGTKYTDSFGADFLDESGKPQKIIMGCYGIGVTRIIAACIEQNNDEYGIIWSKEICPFEVLVMPLNTDNPELAGIAHKIYNELKNNDLDVLLDDRDLRAGTKFKDADLVGIPVQVVIGEKGLKQDLVEIKIRKNNQKTQVLVKDVISKVKDILEKLV
ncbi:MAG: proline--tRNA ligase [Candidatus Omnitrophota bacterium]